MTARTVQAVVFSGDGRWEVRKLARPDPPPGGAVLRVEAVGLCGSDVGQFHGGIGLPGETFPVVPGHEIVGRIDRVTPEAATAWNVEEGDRVCVDEILRCGACRACRTTTGPCQRMQLYGYTMGVDDGPGLWGGYGEEMVLVPGTNLYKVPGDIPAEELTLFEPLASAVNWVTVADVGLGDTVVIQGPGHQGLACLIAARAKGASSVIITGTSIDGVRFDAARRLGAAATIDVEAEDAVTRVAELTGGEMADVVMDVAAGSTATVPLSLQLVRGGGRVVQAGLKHFAPVEGFVSDLLVFKQLTMIGGSGYTPASMGAAVDLLVSGRVDRGAMVGDTVTLDEIDRGLALLTRQVPDYDTHHVSLVLA